ncbi:MAG: GGDEF domain-containing protein [Acidimicrobiales bacterium]
MRLLGALVFVLADHGLDFEDVEPLAGLVPLGALAGGAAAFGPRTARSVAFEIALAVDIAVLAIVVHQTGGLASPLLPLVALWTVLAVIAHSTVGAALWTTGLVIAVFGVGALARLLDLQVDPPATGGRSLLVVSGLIVATAAVASEQAARRLDAAERHLQALALRDPMTGLWNRRAFDQRLAAASAAATRGRPSVLAVIDVDHFKQINDQHGHPAGDRALTHLATTLVRETRIDDECFRIGGEEFAVLMPATTTDEAKVVLQRARTALVASPPATGPLTFSAGLVSLEGADDPSRSFALADQALYEAKASGRNTDRAIEPEPAVL